PGGPCGVALDGTHVLFSNGATDGSGLFWLGRANLDGSSATTEFLRTNGAVGVAVSPQAAVTPPTVPAAPVIGAATPGNASATVRWTPPADNGGSPVTGYLVRVLDSTGTQAGGLRPAGAAATSLAVTGLANGTSYRFQVAAVNAAGTGPDSALSAAVTPAAVPGAPGIGTAAPGPAGGAPAANPPGGPPGTPGGARGVGGDGVGGARRGVRGHGHRRGAHKTGVPAGVGGAADQAAAGGDLRFHSPGQKPRRPGAAIGPVQPGRGAVAAARHRRGP